MLAEINTAGLTGSQLGLPGSGAISGLPNPGTPSIGSYDDKDLFYLQLYRDQPAAVSAPAQYNGNISYALSRVTFRFPRPTLIVSSY